MSIEMVVHLLDTPSFLKLCDLNWKELYDSAQNRKLRELRPDMDEELHRRHDIDSEVELLDWMDSSNLVDVGENFISTICLGISDCKLDFENACEGIYQLIEFCCIGFWEVWEARAYLYFEKILNIEVGNIEELYAEEVWANLIEKVTQITSEEYSEIVIMDWMHRREKLGETLDETRDPRILPTMTSHSKLTKTLHHLFTICKNNTDYEIIVGRVHLNKSKWGHGMWNIGNILRRNENFK